MSESAARIAALEEDIKRLTRDNDQMLFDADRVRAHEEWCQAIAERDAARQEHRLAEEHNALIVHWLRRLLVHIDGEG